MTSYSYCGIVLRLGALRSTLVTGSANSKLTQVISGVNYFLFKRLYVACQELYVPPGLTLKNSTWLLHSICEFSNQTATVALYNINSLVFFYNRGGKCLQRGTD